MESFHYRNQIVVKLQEANRKRQNLADTHQSSAGNLKKLIGIAGGDAPLDICGVRVVSTGQCFDVCCGFGVAGSRYLAGKSAGLQIAQEGNLAIEQDHQ